MRPKPKVGDVLFLVECGYRNTDPLKYYDVVVESVGRKLFKVKYQKHETWWPTMSFYLENWREQNEYSPRHALYLNEQEYQDKLECGKICEKIWHSFEYGHNKKNLTLEQLRIINNLIA